MRKHILGLIALFFVSSLSHTIAQTESKNILKSLAFIKSHESFLCDAGQKYETDPHEVIAIGFPFLLEYFERSEMSAYNGIESIYIHLGGRESNLKAGEFQLQSSMVENIEKIISNHPKVFEKFQFINEFAQDDERSIRAERLERMKNTEWQFTYLFAFKAISDSCFFGEDFESTAEKIAFYSVAFHLGFETKMSDIKACYRSFQSDKDLKNLSDCKVRAAISADFMENHAPMLNCTFEVARG